MSPTLKPANLALFPLKSRVNESGHLTIGDCDVTELARSHGTPLYLYDEETLRYKCREFTGEFRKRYTDTTVVYASKASSNRALVALIKEEGLGLDVVSGGELSIARSVGFDPGKVYFHGNNKTPEELNLALDWGVGRVVVDNQYELDLLNQLAGKRNVTQNILLRVNPGVDAHTHRHTTTAVLDSKFGLPISTGQAEAAVGRARKLSNLKLKGLHFHLGSPVSEVLPYETAIELVFGFAKHMAGKYGFQLDEFSVGGGFAVQYTADLPVLGVQDYATSITSKIAGLVRDSNSVMPGLIIEPGRAIVAQAGVALYTVGAIKDIPGARKYVCVDGGMGDNIRPALYGAKYEAVVANRILEPEAEIVTIAGKYCESGDILVKDVSLVPVVPGDTIAVPVCGAYCPAMASNYNAIGRPAMVMLNNGKSKVIRRRESYEDIMRLDDLE